MQKKRSTISFGKTDETYYSSISLLVEFIIMIVFCFAGIFCKKVINPFANVVTDSLHIPGGISTAVSLMFMVMASAFTSRKWSATAMGIMQAAFALAMGSVGSMGVFLPVSYVIPGIVIDLVMVLYKKEILTLRLSAFIANILSSVSAAVIADIIVFHLPVPILTLYLCVAALSGAICGAVAAVISSSIMNNRKEKDEVNGND